MVGVFFVVIAQQAVIRADVKYADLFRCDNCGSGCENDSESHGKDRMPTAALARPIAIEPKATR